MSVVIDHVRHVDGQLDRLQLSKTPSALSSPAISLASDDSQAVTDSRNEPPNLFRILQLQAALSSLSTVSLSRTLLRPSRLHSIIEQAQLSSSPAGAEGQGPSNEASSQEQELEWLVVSKATVQAYGVILNVLLEQTIPLSNDLWYWDEVLGSYTYTGLYSVQYSPQRLWRWASGIYHDAWQKLQVAGNSSGQEAQKHRSISNRWRQFYGLVKHSIRERSLADMRSKFMSPLTMCVIDARAKQSHLKRLREMSACGLGMLMDEGLIFDVNADALMVSKSRTEGDREEWKTVVSKSIALMESVLHNVTILELGPGEFEDTVFMSVEDEPGLARDRSSEGQLPSSPASLCGRLQQILQVHIPNHITASKVLAARYGRPSRLVRYWLPVTILLFSSSTLLRVLVNRKAEVRKLIRDLGTTTVDFWYNWVVEPGKKLIGTIRHDEASEIAIMSKESLKGDRASLERMVVDFAKDNPSSLIGAPLTEVEIVKIRAKVRAGDLTPVLRAYEKDLRNPFIGTVRGDLIRALLIQVQKSKVDVEVALGGIDSLLKSQELVFGFVGLTPGVLVCLGASRWLGGFLGGRKGRTKGKMQSQIIRVLRNIDRILSASTPSNSGMLSYKEHGMLLCEVHVLRQRAQQVLPGEINAEFLEEVNDLVDLRTGVERQVRVVERIRWAYSKWLQGCS